MTREKEQLRQQLELLAELPQREGENIKKRKKEPVRVGEEVHIMGEPYANLTVDCTDLISTIEKLIRLVDLLREASSIVDSLGDGLEKQEELFRLLHFFVKDHTPMSARSEKCKL